MTSRRSALSTPPPPEKIPTILIVDDEALTRDILVYHLTQFGYQTRVATDGQEGLDSVASHPPDLILCDVKMPRLDGMGVVQKLKGNPETRLIPIVMLTSMTDLETKVRALQLARIIHENEQNLTTRT